MVSGEASGEAEAAPVSDGGDKPAWEPASVPVSDDGKSPLAPAFALACGTQPAEPAISQAEVPVFRLQPPAVQAPEPEPDVPQPLGFLLKN